MTQLIILRGYPGSGKTTIGKALEKQNVGKFIDHNAILTFVAGISGDDDGIYDDISNLEKAITRKLLKSNTTTIIARGFSSSKSLEDYIKIADSLGMPTKVIRLSVGRDELTRRVASPERKEDFNPTINEKSLTHWVKENPIVDYRGEIIIDNSRPVNDATRSIIAQI